MPENASPTAPPAVPNIPQNGVGGRPDPDPTILTAQSVALATDTLRRELRAAVQILEAKGEMLEAKANGRQTTLETRLNGMDTAITLVRETADRLPARMDEKVQHLEDLTNEKFSTVDQKFSTVDKEFALGKEYTTQSAIDRKEELKTALSAAEKAVDKNAASFTSATDKSEKATGELLRQQAELLRSTKEGLDSQIGDLKVRLATAEATASAAREAAAAASANASAAATAASAARRAETTDKQGTSSFNLSMIVALIAAAGLVLVLLRDFGAR